jgi:hypothetical protein
MACFKPKFILARKILVSGRNSGDHSHSIHKIAVYAVLEIEALPLILDLGCNPLSDPMV